MATFAMKILECGEFAPTTLPPWDVLTDRLYRGLVQLCGIGLSGDTSPPPSVRPE